MAGRAVPSFLNARCRIAEVVVVEAVGRRRRRLGQLAVGWVGCWRLIRFQNVEAGEEALRERNVQGSGTSCGRKKGRLKLWSATAAEG